MMVSGVTVPPEPSIDSSNKLCADNTNTEPSDKSCSNSVTASGEKAAANSTNGSISVDIDPRIPSTPNIGKVQEAYIPQQRTLPKFTISEEEDTSGYDSDGVLGPFYDVLDTEGEQDFDEDSRPSIEPVLMDDNNEEDVAIAVKDNPYHIPIEDAIIKKLKVS